MRRVLGLALLLAIEAACAAALRQPTAADVQAVAVRWPDTGLADLERGRKTFVRRCSSCHTLILPSAHPTEEWPRLVARMAKRARLTPEQKLDITRFVVALSREEPSR